MKSWRLKTADALLCKEENVEDIENNRKTVSAPAAMFKDKVDEVNDKIEHKLTPVQEALENATKLRQSIREDKLAGISSTGTYTSSELKINENRKSAGVRTNRPSAGEKMKVSESKMAFLTPDLNLLQYQLNLYFRNVKTS